MAGAVFFLTLGTTALPAHAGLVSADAPDLFTRPIEFRYDQMVARPGSGLPPFVVFSLYDFARPRPPVDTLYAFSLTYLGTPATVTDVALMYATSVRSPDDPRAWPPQQRQYVVPINPRRYPGQGI